MAVVFFCFKLHLMVDNHTKVTHQMNFECIKNEADFQLKTAGLEIQ